MLSESDLRRIVFIHHLMLEDTSNHSGWRAIFERIGPSIREKTQDVCSFFKILSEDIQDRLEKRNHLRLENHFRHRSLQLGLRICLLLVTFLLGMATNYLGSNRTVNLWLNPFMAFLAWNALVFVFLFIKQFIKLKRAPEESLVLPWALRPVQWLQHQWYRHGLASYSEAKLQVLFGRVQVAFRRDWYRLFPSLSINRLAYQLHLMAIFLTIGVLVGLYFRGFAEAYQFTWESTLIDPDARAFWLGILFAPILWLAKPLFPGGLPAFEQSDGAAWIHLFAFSGLVYILLPRLCLVIMAHRRIRKIRDNLQLPWQAPSWQAFYAQANQTPIPLHFIFYSYTPEAKLLIPFQKSLRKTLPENFGKCIDYDIEWGETKVDGIALEEPGFWILFFNGAQTPEEEVHGQFCNDLRQALDATKPPKALLIIVDPMQLPTNRLETRRSLWSELFHSQSIDVFAWLPLDEGNLSAAKEMLQKAVIRFGS